MLALDPSQADIIVGFLAFGGVVFATVTPLYFQQRKSNRVLLEQQRKVHEDNRLDHADTAMKVDSLLTTAHVLHAKVESVDSRLDMVHDDLKHVKHSLRDHSIRIHDLEVS